MMILKRQASVRPHLASGRRNEVIDVQTDCVPTGSMQTYCTLSLHRAPIPEEEPIPGEEPEPDDDPVPHPDPVIREPQDAPPLHLMRKPHVQFQDSHP